MIFSASVPCQFPFRAVQPPSANGESPTKDPRRSSWPFRRHTNSGPGAHQGNGRSFGLLRDPLAAPESSGWLGASLWSPRDRNGGLLPGGGVFIFPEGSSSSRAPAHHSHSFHGGETGFGDSAPPSWQPQAAPSVHCSPAAGLSPLRGQKRG